ncbi:hypothetical protein DL98DRAFT_491236, partial [Cadophora sp. DSE1049]
MPDVIQPKAGPPLDLPRGDVCCDVSIINTTTEMTIPTHTLLEPVIGGHEWLNLPTYAFHIKNQETGAQILFDLGARRDWWNLAPSAVDSINQHVPGLRITQGMDEILQEGGVDLSQIAALVLSHWHWDHVGDPSKFPKHSELVVGPGFKDCFLPGYPTQNDGAMRETDFEGRHVNEISFTDSFKIGKFRAHDYFGDGSFYVLDVPGHAIGHISALVRDTPSTFVFLGGDVTHFGGALRPTEYIPLPHTLPGTTLLDTDLPTSCPCSIFTRAHPILNSSDGLEGNAATTPFYSPSSSSSSWYIDPPIAKESIGAVTEFDSSPDVLLILAHDVDNEKYFPCFPNGRLNGWKSRGEKDRSHWRWVNELPRNGKSGRGIMVEG